MEHTKGKIIDRTKHSRPTLIKKGSGNLLLGWGRNPPRVDCRVVADELYVDMELSYDAAPDMLKALEKGLKEIIFCLDSLLFHTITDADKRQEEIDKNPIVIEMRAAISKAKGKV